MDLGGASAQITFSPIHASVMEDYYGVHLGGHTIRLYSHSFLGYGWDDALLRLSTRLAVETILASLRSRRLKEDSNAAPEIRTLRAVHPCYPQGKSH